MQDDLNNHSFKKVFSHFNIMEILISFHFYAFNYNYFVFLIFYLDISYNNIPNKVTCHL